MAILPGTHLERSLPNSGVDDKVAFKAHLLDAPLVIAFPTLELAMQGFFRSKFLPRDIALLRRMTHLDIIESMSNAIVHFLELNDDYMGQKLEASIISLAALVRFGCLTFDFSPVTLCPGSSLGPCNEDTGNLSRSLWRASRLPGSDRPAP